MSIVVYTLSVWALEESPNFSATCRRNSACICVLFVSLVDFVVDAVESVVVDSAERVSLVVIVEDVDVVFVAVVVDDDATGTSTGLWDTGSTIVNGFLWRFSVWAAYVLTCGRFCCSEGWDVGTCGCSIYL